MKISIIIAVYNGEKYIEEQLLSLLEQSRQADEIVILDDGSSDSTITIIKKILNNYPQNNCKIITNRTNLGWRKNFIKGFHLCSGDLIFCCDQDDIWDHSKLLKMEEIMTRNASIEVLASGLTPIYEDNAKRLARYYTKKFKNKKIEKVELSDYDLRILRPGCTMCFRKTIINMIDTIWREELAHDDVIWSIGLLRDSLYIYNEPLIKFRRHNNTNSPSNKKSLDNRINQARRGYLLRKALYKNRNILGIKKEYEKKQKMGLLYSYERLHRLREKNFLKTLLGITLIPNYKFLRTWIVDIYCLIKSY